MTNNHFEKRIQERLNQFEVQPSENLLENIFEKRAAKTKSVLKFSYFKLGVAMLSIAVVGAVAIIYWPSSDGKMDVVANQAAAVSSAGNASSVVASVNEPNESQSNATIQDQSVESKASDNLKKERGVAVSKRKSNFVERKAADKVAVISSGKIEKSGNRVKQQNNRTADKTESKNRNRIAREEFNDNGANIEERYFSFDSKNRPVLASSEHQGNSHVFVYQSVDNKKLDNLDLNYMFLKPMRSSFATGHNGEQVELINQPTFANHVKQRRPVFVDLLFSPMLSSHNVYGGGDLNENYKSMSKTTFNKQYNVRVSFPVSKNINIFTGLGYMQQTSTFKGDFEKSKDITQYVTVTNYINDPVLGTIPVTRIDTVNTTVKDPLKYSFKNTYQMLNIPLGLSYNFGIDNFDFALHGSALLNVYSHSKGSNADFTNHETASFNSDKMYVGLGGGISFMAAYKLSSRFKLIVEPSLQYFKIQSQKGGNVVNEKILNNGLSLGLRYTVF